MLMMIETIRYFQMRLPFNSKGEQPIHPIPKDQTKFFAWGGFCIKGKISLYVFSKFYVDILYRHLPEIVSSP